MVHAFSKSLMGPKTSNRFPVPLCRSVNLAPHFVCLKSQFAARLPHVFFISSRGISMGSETALVCPGRSRGREALAKPSGRDRGRELLPSDVLRNKIYMIFIQYLQQ